MSPVAWSWGMMDDAKPAAQEATLGNLNMDPKKNLSEAREETSVARQEESANATLRWCVHRSRAALQRAAPLSRTHPLAFASREPTP
jgi:hypothetical protein